MPIKLFPTRSNKTFISLVVTAAILTLLMALMHLLQFMNMNLNVGADLSGTWEVCTPLNKRPLNISFGDYEKSCHWQTTNIPGVEKRTNLNGTPEWLIYRRTFSSKSAWLNSDDSYALLIGGIIHGAIVNINGLTIGHHYTRAELYPAIVDIPTKLLNADHQSNKIFLAVYKASDANSIGIAKTPIVILPKKSAIHAATTLIVGTVVLPILTAIGLFTLALVALLARISTKGPDSTIAIYIAYCLASAAFEISASRIPREFFPYYPSYSFHYFLRFLMDWLFFRIACHFYTKRKNIWIRLVNISYILIFSTFLALTIFVSFNAIHSHNLTFSSLSVLLSRNIGFRELNYIYLLTCLTIPTTILGTAVMLLGSFREKELAPEHSLLLIISVLIIPMQICDTLTIWGIIYTVRENYFVRFYPFFLALGSGFVIWVQLLRRQRATEGTLRVGELAEQVAHDIRSPLAALNSAVATLNQLPEEKRLLIRSAVSRIKDIANNLLKQNQINTKNDILVEPTSTQLISTLLEPLLSEKRMQYRSRLGLAIECTLDAGSYGLFTRLQANEFKRLISNLINNSAEAILENGRITISITESGAFIEIAIKDNGKGIPQEILPRLAKKGASFGKPEGIGLGLYHAKETIESWNGELEIKSEESTGTTVTLRVPKASPPEWFLKSLQLTGGTNLAIVDDDQSVHHIWKGRAEFLRLGEYGIKLLHFSSPKELTDWHRTKNASFKNTVYLVDYEFFESKENGLNLVESLGLVRQSVLVTSHSEETPIYEQCIRIGIRIIPKSLVGFVPIQVEEIPSRVVPLVDAVLIDDDPLVHTMWKLSAIEAGKNLSMFKSSAVFIEQLEKIPTNTPLYIDSNLANGEKGEILAEQLHKKGFTQIYLATGYEPSQFSHLTWLKGVVGKDPPWG